MARACLGDFPERDPERGDVDIVTSAVFSWCAERRISLRTQAGVHAASAAIELFERGYRTPDALFHALHGLGGSEMAHDG